MKRLIAIDPDTVASGLAFFEDGVLSTATAFSIKEAMYNMNAFWMPTPHPETEMVCEMPQQYGRVGDVRDFLAVARVVGRFEQMAYERGYAFRSVTPKQWKGETPKEICTLRAFKALDDTERANIAAPTVALNKLRKGIGLRSGSGSDVMDAVGIGLWAVGRLGKFARAA